MLYWRGVFSLVVGLIGLTLVSVVSFAPASFVPSAIMMFLVGQGLQGHMNTRAIAQLGWFSLIPTLLWLVDPKLALATSLLLVPIIFSFFWSKAHPALTVMAKWLFGSITDHDLPAIHARIARAMIAKYGHQAQACITIKSEPSKQRYFAHLPQPGFITLTSLHTMTGALTNPAVMDAMRKDFQALVKRETGWALGFHTALETSYQESAHETLNRLAISSSQQSAHIHPTR